MEPLFGKLPVLLSALWWPFCRALAMFSAAPIVGENMVPVVVRVLLSLVLAIVMLPIAQAPVAIDPFSMHGVLATVQQGLIGFVIGFAFHLTISVVMTLGYLVSSQMGLSMAVMNDPMNGTSSDVISTLLYVLLVLVGVLGESFRAWPVGQGFAIGALQGLALNVAWVFSAALLLAVPVIFSALVVQIGVGFLNRVAPSLNLFSLGFSLVTVFGLFMLARMLRFVPEHYIRMTGRVLQMLRQDFGI